MTDKEIMEILETLAKAFPNTTFKGENERMQTLADAVTAKVKGDLQ